MEVFNFFKVGRKMLGHTLRVAFNSREQLQKPVLHPLMPYVPRTVLEAIRLYPWRYNWRYSEFSILTLSLVFSVCSWLCLVKPRYREQIIHVEHYFHAELPVEIMHGYKQKLQDKEYFAKHYPLQKKKF